MTKSEEAKIRDAISKITFLNDRDFVMPIEAYDILSPFLRVFVNKEYGRGEINISTNYPLTLGFVISADNVKSTFSNSKKDFEEEMETFFMIGKKMKLTDLYKEVTNEDHPE